MGSVGALILTRTFSGVGTVGCQTEGRRRIPWTGYSSLHRLKALPIDLLKIDRSFVRDVATGPDSATLTTAMIGLDRNLRLEVVAEYVETEEQMPSCAPEDATWHRASSSAARSPPTNSPSF